MNEIIYSGRCNVMGLVLCDRDRMKEMVLVGVANENIEKFEDLRAPWMHLVIDLIFSHMRSL